MNEPTIAGLSNRQLFGLGFIGLLIIALLRVWQLLAKRDSKGEEWGVSEVHPDLPETPSKPSGEGNLNVSGDNAPSNGHSYERVGVDARLAATREVIHHSETNPRRLGISRGWAVDVHSPQVRSLLRRAPRTMVQRTKARRATALMNKWKATDRVSVPPKRKLATSTPRPVVTHRPGHNAPEERVFLEVLR